MGGWPDERPVLLRLSGWRSDWVQRVILQMFLFEWGTSHHWQWGWPVLRCRWAYFFTYLLVIIGLMNTNCVLRILLLSIEIVRAQTWIPLEYESSCSCFEWYNGNSVSQRTFWDIHVLRWLSCMQHDSFLSKTGTSTEKITKATNASVTWLQEKTRAAGWPENEQAPRTTSAKPVQVCIW
jgi:hypothetical protein